LIVADSSVWIELFRDTGHAAAKTLERLVLTNADLAITEVIVMELLAGSSSGGPSQSLRSRLLAYPVLPLNGLADYEEAATISRACRDGGRSLRGITDCLIAVPVIHAGASLLHNDADFDVIARYSGLKVLRS